MPNPSIKSPAILVATCFGIGFLRKAPGTWGALLALPFAWILRERLDITSFMLIIMVLFFLGMWASKVYLLKLNCENKDPSAIVVDEFVGQCLTVAPFSPDIANYLFCFILFRLFDIFKPWPVNWVDENIKGSLGIMLDDVLAAVYSATCFFILLQTINIKIEN